MLTYLGRASHISGLRVLLGADMRTLSLCIVAATLLISCSKEPEYTSEQRACISRQNAYDPKQMDQCVKVCKACLDGNTVTCTTSCTLRGAI
jgi:hypothetical protein